MDIGESRSGFSWRTLVVTAYILQNVNGECRDSATWCPQYAHRCDESVLQTSCPLTCGVCTTTTAATTSSSTTTARTVTGECRDQYNNWCLRNAHRCDESYYQTNCQLTCGGCTTTTAAATTSSSTTTARTVTAVGTGCIGGNCDQQCTCYDRKDCRKRNGRCPYGRCAPEWRGFPGCSRRDCSVNNGGCRQKCVSGRVSNGCACWEGYVLQDDGVTCVENDSLCLRDRKGSEYRGTVSVTWGGETCRSWTEVSGTPYDHNYCRNPPGGTDPRPWCMVAPYTTHEPCNIALCTAVDPCHTSNHECPQECVSLQATSYYCRCYPGYSGNGRVCNDIDECTGDSHECSSREQCVNIAGGYYCECATGYRLDTDTNQCTACTSGTFGESCSGTCHCLDNSSCNHTTGVCLDGQCAAGWTGYNCQSPCTQGSFGPSCGGVCHCLYDRYCDRVDGTCSLYGCEAGWRGDTCQQDVDECADREQHRVDRRCHECINTDGSYTCDCDTGYQLSITGRYCVDINQCYNREESGVPASCYRCDNLPGSYECRCDTGYEPSDDRKSCDDVDECADRIHHRVDSRCHECTNTDGSYTCDCDTGYQLYRRGRYCVDIDECNNREESGVPASCYRCDNLQGSYECRCYTGYEPSDDRKSCVECMSGKFGVSCGEDCHCLDDKACNKTDGACPGNLCAEGWTGPSCQKHVDECTVREQHGVDSRCHECTNTDGSYTCDCNTGYQLHRTGRYCVACSRGFYGVNCTFSCHCHNGSACLAQDGRCPYGRCSPGWRGFPSCNYRDCALNNGGCQQRCESGQEWDWCSCWKGYILLEDGTTCTADDSICLRDANGLEYNGTLSVSSTGKNCRPWNSVDYPEYGHKFCRNQAESLPKQPWCFSAQGQPVTCSIPICSELDQCADGNGGCQQECSSSAQKPHHCNRFPGYQGVDALIRNCADIDECSEGSHSCTDGECCVNTDGGYYCECAAGYLLDMDTYQCTASATDSSLGACGHQYNISSLAPAAIGGGLGGLAFIVLLAVVLIMVYRKRRSQSAQSGSDGEQRVDYVNVTSNDQATDGKCESPMLHDEMEGSVYDEIADPQLTRSSVLGTEPKEGMYTVPPISASSPVHSCYDALLHAPIADAVETSVV